MSIFKRIFSGRPREGEWRIGRRGREDSYSEKFVDGAWRRMLTRIVNEDRAWVESIEGFRVEACMWNGNASWVVYTEGDREILLDAVFWHESKEDREAVLAHMSARHLGKYLERTVTLIRVPDVLRWHKSADVVSPDDRSRILENIQRACELENMKPRFVKE
jgi:hypothetical protein